MLAGIGFLAVLTATIASRFVAQDQADENEEIISALKRLEADVAELKSRLLSEQANAEEHLDGAEPVAPGDLLALVVAAAVVGDRQLVDPQLAACRSGR